MAYKNPSDPRLKAARLKHYYANKEQYIVKTRRTRQEMKEYVNLFKESFPCKDCNIYYDAVCMDFDHISNNKINGIAVLRMSGSWTKLQDEIDKCELVCSNCHRLRTRNRAKLV